MKIFVYAMRDDEKVYFDKFSRELGFEYESTSAYPSMENIVWTKGFDAVSLITNVLTDEMFETWKSYGIKYIATRSIGYEHLFGAKLKKLGIRGVHASYSPNAVANYTIMLMLMACRNICYILDKSRMQDFSLLGKGGKEISLCTIGVVGTGRIGETLIEHLSGFGCRILAYDLYQKENVKKYAEYVDLDTLYAESDIITLHVPGGEANRHMINKDTISRMKDGVILVNAARGMLVDSEALIEGLETGKVGFAALDTFDEELNLYYKNLELSTLTNRNRSILMSFPNVILSPHMAFYTDQSVSDMVGTTVKGICDLDRTGESVMEITYE